MTKFPFSSSSQFFLENKASLLPTFSLKLAYINHLPYRKLKMHRGSVDQSKHVDKEHENVKKKEDTEAASAGKPDPLWLPGVWWLRAEAYLGLAVFFLKYHTTTQHCTGRRTDLSHKSGFTVIYYSALDFEAHLACFLLLAAPQKEEINMVCKYTHMYTYICLWILQKYSWLLWLRCLIFEEACQWPFWASACSWWNFQPHTVSPVLSMHTLSSLSVAFLV